MRNKKADYFSFGVLLLIQIFALSCYIRCRLGYKRRDCPAEATAGTGRLVLTKRVKRAEKKGHMCCRFCSYPLARMN